MNISDTKVSDTLSSSWASVAPCISWDRMGIFHRFHLVLFVSVQNNARPLEGVQSRSVAPEQARLWLIYTAGGKSWGDTDVTRQGNRVQWTVAGDK